MNTKTKGRDMEFYEMFIYIGAVISFLIALIVCKERKNDE